MTARILVPLLLAAFVLPLPTALANCSYTTAPDPLFRATLTTCDWDRDSTTDGVIVNFYTGQLSRSFIARAEVRDTTTDETPNEATGSLDIVEPNGSRLLLIRGSLSSRPTGTTLTTTTPAGTGTQPILPLGLP